MLNRLVLKNFTAFDSLDVKFSPGINLFIGQNGTGKTHILKILYTPLSALKQKKRISDKLIDVFLPGDRFLGRIVKRSKVSTKATVKIFRNSKELFLTFSNHTEDTVKWRNGWQDNKINPCVYIPVKEMLANAPGFLSLFKNREIHFEEVYADIISAAFVPKLKGPPTRDRQYLLNMIQQIIEGKVITKNEQFFLRNRSGELEFTLLAEGMRKLGLLWLLIQNGTLLNGSTLFWDEPEANLNPSMLNILVRILLHLQRTGVQIFIATHNYVLLKEFDLQKIKNKDMVKFFLLEFEKDSESIKCKEGNKYIDVIPNVISQAYTGIYNEEVKQSIGGI